MKFCEEIDGKETHWARYVFERDNLCRCVDMPIPLFPGVTACYSQYIWMRPLNYRPKGGAMKGQVVQIMAPCHYPPIGGVCAGKAPKQ